MAQPDRPPPALSGEEIERAIRGTIPLAATFPWSVREVWTGGCRVTATFDKQHERAGGTVSGPMLFTLADTAMYVAVLATIGLELLAVTSDTTLHFVRRLPPGSATAHATVLRRGRRLLVASVAITGDGDGEMIAHAVGTYALP